MLRKSAILLLLLVAITSASYPKVSVLFKDPKEYIGESKCCMGVFNTPHGYKGAYRVTALYFSSHVRNYATGEEGEELQDIQFQISEQPAGGEWRYVAKANFSQRAPPTQLLRVPVSYVTDPTAWYIMEIQYGGSLTYPRYDAIDVSAGPYNTTYNAFILGIDYEAI